MVKSKKPAKAKKKAKTKTVRKDGSVRTTPEAAAKIQKIAEGIFKQFETSCKANGFNKPSAKLAIDYLLFTESYTNGYLTEEEALANNAYDDIRRFSDGGD